MSVVTFEGAMPVQVVLPSRPKAALGRAVLLGFQLLTVVVFLVAWETASNRGSLNPFLFSRPTEVFDTLREWLDDGTLIESTLFTLRVTTTGWVAGVALGTLLGAAIGLSPLLRDFFEPFLVFFNSLPRLLLLPFLIIWLGFGLTPKVTLVVFVIVFVVAITVESGLRDVSDDYRLNALALGASRWHLVRQVYGPSTLLWILASARTTVGYAFQAAVAAEFVGSTVGLGYLSKQGQTLLNVQETYAALAVLFVLGLAFDLVLGVVQNRVTRWMPSTGR